MQTLKDWVNERFFQKVKPFQILAEDGKRLEVNFNDFGKYKIIETRESKDKIFVTVQPL